MTGEDLRAIRDTFGLGKTAFALLLGYTGSDVNNHTRIKKLEKGDELVPLYIARFVWLIHQRYIATGKLPSWPEELRIEDGTEPWM